MDIAQPWQALSALAERPVAWLASLSIPGVRVVDGLLLLSALLLLAVTLLLLRQHRRVKQIEQARNNAEALASCLFDALPDPAAITDPEGRFLSVNPAFARLVGRDEREIGGALLTDLFTPSVAEHFQYRPVEGEEDEFRKSFRIRADHPTRFLAHKTPLFDTEGLLVGILTQLSPLRESTPLARPAKSRRLRGRRSAGVRTVPVDIEIGTGGETATQPPAAEPAGKEAFEAEGDTRHREPEVRPPPAPDFPDSASPPNARPVAEPDGMPNLVEALQIAVKITSNTDRTPPATERDGDGEGEPREHDDAPRPLADSRFQHPPKDDPNERSLRGLGKR